VNNGRNYQPQLVIPGFLPSTVSQRNDFFLLVGAPVSYCLDVRVFEAAKGRSGSVDKALGGHCNTWRRRKTTSPEFSPQKVVKSKGNGTPYFREIGKVAEIL